MAEAQWYYSRGGQQTGPVTIDQLRQMAATGQITPQDLVWRDGMAQWQPIGTLPEFGGAPAGPAAYAQGPGQVPPGYQPPYQTAPGGSRESHQGMAITGFILSLVGVPCCGFILGPVGAVLGFLALNGMKRTGNQAGRGLALAAVIIGIIALILNLIIIPMRWNAIMQQIHQQQQMSHPTASP